MNIQWYPGHMTKAKRAMTDDLRLVSLVIELADARAPLSSRNPDIDRMAAGKDRIILLNKSDLADPKATEQWKAWYESRGIRTVLMDSRQMKDPRLLCFRPLLPSKSPAVRFLLRFPASSVRSILQS